MIQVSYDSSLGSEPSTSRDAVTESFTKSL